MLTDGKVSKNNFSFRKMNSAPIQFDQIFFKRIFIFVQSA
jgi:hypothetical protein